MGARVLVEVELSFKQPNVHRPYGARYFYFDTSILDGVQHLSNVEFSPIRSLAGKANYALLH